MAPGGILRFEDFAMDMPEDVLLRERASHLSHDTVEAVVFSWKRYGAVIVRDWYHELPSRVREIIDEDTTNSFHFFSIGEMMMTPFDFSMITGLRVGVIRFPSTSTWASGRQLGYICLGRALHWTGRLWSDTVGSTIVFMGVSQRLRRRWSSTPGAF
ncbi:hypothetical protein ACSBR1_015159 [Camellia fascicularis]